MFKKLILCLTMLASAAFGQEPAAALPDCQAIHKAQHEKLVAAGHSEVQPAELPIGIIFTYEDKDKHKMAGIGFFAKEAGEIRFPAEVKVLAAGECIVNSRVYQYKFLEKLINTTQAEK